MSEPRCVGVLGGTFDPIHRGHLAMARAAERACALERIYFVPAPQPWHRRRPPQAGYADRFAMVALALQSHPRWLPLDIADARGHATYTLDQLRWIRTRGLGREVVFIIGADSFATLPKWHRWRELLVSCHWLVLARGEWEWEALRGRVPRALVSGTKPAEMRLRGGHWVRWVARFTQPASGSRARQQFSLGAEAPVPAAVAAYARRANLYKVHGQNNR